MLFDMLLDDIVIPRFVRVRDHRVAERIEDVAAAVRQALDSRGAKEALRPGMRVCVCCGSREIANFQTIVRAVVDYVRACGAEPFIIPTMGSHGGATAEGQRAILEGYGLTEDVVGAPIRATMETVEIGRADNGMSVQLDVYANEADYIIPIARVKPHTDFHGRIESGLCKMLVIGLGKQHGAYICHKYGFHNMAKNIWSISRTVVEKKPNLMALSVIENCFHETYRIDAVPAARIHEEEPELLEIARAQMGRLPFDEADTLIVNEIGKEISGAGMDPNITGRYTCLPNERPFFQSIAVLDVTEKSHGNCGGIGAADVTTRRLFEKFDFEATYPNAITVGNGLGTRIPPVMPNDRLAVKFALRGVSDFKDERELIRAIWIRNTLALDEFMISESLLPEARANPELEILGEPEEIRFDEQGALLTKI